MLPAMNITPMNPPSHAHHGCEAAVDKSGTSAPLAPQAMMEATTTAMMKDTNVAPIGEPTLCRSRVLMAVWTGTIAPTSMAKSSSMCLPPSS